MDYDNLDTCANCGEVLTIAEQHENVDLCHKCFDLTFEDL